MKSDVLESDPLFTLLTDALRAGPGSPEWHQAVARLREDGANGSDEYKLLQTAREHLESGRDFRAVRAGWREIGRLPLHYDGSLRPAVMPMSPGDYIGGGVVTAEALAASEPFTLEAVVTVPETPGDFVAEVFVSDSADFSEFRATAPAELVWLLQGAEQKVMVKGRNEGRVETLKQFDKPLTVRLVVGRER